MFGYSYDSKKKSILELELEYYENIKRYYIKEIDFNIMFANSPSNIKPILTKIVNDEKLSVDENKKIVIFLDETIKVSKLVIERQDIPRQENYEEYKQMRVEEEQIEAQVKEAENIKNQQKRNAIEEIRKRRKKEADEIIEKSRIKKNEEEDLKRKNTEDKRRKEQEKRIAEERDKEIAVTSTIQLIMSNEKVTDIIDKYLLVNRALVENKLLASDYLYYEENNENDYLFRMIHEYIDIKFTTIVVHAINDVMSKRVQNIYSNKFINKYRSVVHKAEETNIYEIIESFLRYTQGEYNPIDIISMWFFLNQIYNTNKLEFDEFSYVFDEMEKEFKEKIMYEKFKDAIDNYSPDDSVYYSIHDIDMMNGYEFEEFIAKLFSLIGYEVEVTKASGDQGLDVLAKKHGKLTGIQAKCYAGKVNNSAVQEIVAAMKYYNCEKGMVITNNYFTESAIELADANNIILWDRDLLVLKIKEIQLTI